MFDDVFTRPKYFAQVFVIFAAKFKCFDEFIGNFMYQPIIAPQDYPTPPQPPPPSYTKPPSLSSPHPKPSKASSKKPSNS